MVLLCALSLTFSNISRLFFYSCSLIFLRLFQWWKEGKFASSVQFATSLCTTLGIKITRDFRNIVQCYRINELKNKRTYSLIYSLIYSLKELILSFILSFSEFTTHIRSHNVGAGALSANLEKALEDNDSNSAQNGSNACAICGKALSSPSSLDRHMLIHSGSSLIHSLSLMFGNRPSIMKNIYYWPCFLDLKF